MAGGTVVHAGFRRSRNIQLHVKLVECSCMARLLTMPPPNPTKVVPCGQLFAAKPLGCGHQWADQLQQGILLSFSGLGTWRSEVEPADPGF